MGCVLVKLLLNLTTGSEKSQRDKHLFLFHYHLFLKLFPFSKMYVFSHYSHIHKEESHFKLSIALICFCLLPGTIKFFKVDVFLLRTKQCNTYSHQDSTNYANAFAMKTFANRFPSLGHLFQILPWSLSMIWPTEQIIHCEAGHYWISSKMLYYWKY